MGYADCEEEADRFAKSLLARKYPTLTLIGYLLIMIFKPKQDDESMKKLYNGFVFGFLLVRFIFIWIKPFNDKALFMWLACLSIGFICGVFKWIYEKQSNG